APAGTLVPELDAVAALAADGALLVSVVNRGTAEPVRLTVSAEGFPTAGECQVTELSAENPWDANTLEEPEKVKPRRRGAEFREGRIDLAVAPCSLLLLRLPPK
ncbi:MAG: alpha-L-arabinofuranosidase C-terminal domain-containing protein, partial [Planctomycetota bacterium]